MELVLNPRLQKEQKLFGCCGCDWLTLERESLKVFRIDSLVFLIAKFLALACSLKRLRTQFLRNQRAEREESGIMELPWIWIVLVEW